MSDKNTILANALDKLDSVDFSFESITSYDLESPLNDTMREIGTTIDNIVTGSSDEIYIELRVVWWFLFRVRNSSATAFKYTSGNNGESIDKTSVAKQIQAVMNNIDEQFQKWLSNRKAITSNSSQSKLWNRTATSSDTLSDVTAD